MSDSALFSPISEVPISGLVRYRWSRVSDWVPTYASYSLFFYDFVLWSGRDRRFNMYSLMSTVWLLIVLSQHSSIYSFIVTAVFFPTTLSSIKGIENSTFGVIFYVTIKFKPTTYPGNVALLLADEIQYFTLVNPVLVNISWLHRQCQYM